MERRISLKKDKTNRTNQREHSGDLTEKQLTKLLQEAYEGEIPTLSEELLQKTLKKAEAVEQETKEQSKVQISFIKQWIGNVMVKRCVIVGAMCMLLFVCGKLVQENDVFVKKESAPENYDMASAKNETSGGMYFNGSGGSDLEMMADSTQSITEEQIGMEQECADGLSQDKTGTTDNAVMEKIESENGQLSSNEEGFDEDSATKLVETERIYENLAALLPLFPEELCEKEAVYELWIDGVQVESGWETALEDALRYSPPESLALQEEWSAELSEEDTVPTDSFFSEEDILFTLVVSLEETIYYMEVGTCTKVTIEQNKEKRSALFAILDLTLYEEILTMNL